MNTVTEQAFALRKAAEAGPIGKRKSSFELYDLLAGCMNLAERLRGNHVACTEMRLLVSQQPKRDGQRRRYIERDMDEPHLVCRFVFAELKTSGAERSNASRYAATLREAAKVGIRSRDLAAHLRDSGGINALFQRRPLTSLSVTTKHLTLTTPINVPKTGEAVTLKIRRRPDNFYDVIT